MKFTYKNKKGGTGPISVLCLLFMSKNKKILLVFLAFIVCSVLSGVFVYKYLSPQRNTIFVFNDNYEAGVQITKDMLTPMQIDNNIIMNGVTGHATNSFVTVEQYESVIKEANSLRMDVTSGTPLMWSMLSISSGSTVEMNLKTTAVGVSIGVNNVTGVTDGLTGGSRVNIYMSVDGYTTLLLENMRVLDVHHSNGTISSVTIECDITESLMLINANTYGTIHLGIVDSSGYQHSEIEQPTYSLY